MHSMKPINRKARKVEAAVIAASGDVQALQRRGGEGKIYYPMGCTLNFTPGWEVDISGGVAGLCQPGEHDFFDCHLGCGRPAQVAAHFDNAPHWTDKWAAATHGPPIVESVFPE